MHHCLSLTAEDVQQNAEAAAETSSKNSSPHPSMQKPGQQKRPSPQNPETQSSNQNREPVMLQCELQAPGYIAPACAFILKLAWLQHGVE